MEPYRFFFSYASETDRASGNYLEEFFNALCRRVALETGEPIADVGYRDKNRLTLASFWGKDLVNALQRSRVLICIISPHYLNSAACGREVEFFLRRFQLAGQVFGQAQHHRVIPIFWVDKTTCNEHMHAEVDKFFASLQIKQMGMPLNYPYTGLYRYYLLNQQESYNKIIDAIGTAIKQLSDLEGLPALPEANDFSKLPSFFSGRVSTKPSIAEGPKSTNVIYAVATRAEAISNDVSNTWCYAEQRELWRPFTDAPGATVEMATREGLISSGQDDHKYLSLGLPEDITQRLKLAKQANSPVLIVLDHGSLKITCVKASLADYDDLDLQNVGVVTAGGSVSDEPIVAQTMPNKYGQKRSNHLWTIPANRTQFVQDIAGVVGGLRRALQQNGSTATPTPGVPLPGL
jgi:hypothetical protein